MLSFIVASTAATVVPMDGPPLLNSPVFSLATLDNAGQTNMNILTYATPVGIRPHRLWAISLFRETQTHANWLSSGTGVLQQLSSRHAPLMWALGGTSSSEAHADKAAACAALGLPWIEEAETIGGCERLLPGCVSYFRLTQQGALIDAGSHDVAICRLENVLASGVDPGPALSTAELREAGLISVAGRAVEPS